MGETFLRIYEETCEIPKDLPEDFFDDLLAQFFDTTRRSGPGGIPTIVIGGTTGRFFQTKTLEDSRRNVCKKIRGISGKMQKNSLGELSKHLQGEIPRENFEKFYEEYSGKIP